MEVEGTPFTAVSRLRDSPAKISIKGGDQGLDGDWATPEISDRVTDRQIYRHCTTVQIDRYIDTVLLYR